MKKLAEAGDWKAALIIGLTYEFRFVCEKEECELAIRPLFENSRSLSKLLYILELLLNTTLLKRVLLLAECASL